VEGSGFWQLLGDDDRAALQAAARARTFAPGTLLCIEGEPTTHVFIVLSGWVKIITVTREGREMLEALRGAGDVVGEISGTLTGYRMASVHAIGPVSTLIAGAGPFAEFLDTHRNAARAYRRAMAERQRAAFESQRGQVLSTGELDWAALKASTGPVRSRESRISTERPPQAISTHPPSAVLALLLRQVSAEGWLGWAGIEYPSIRRTAASCGDPG
jgi:CRP-like cAMP-binding protein